MWLETTFSKREPVSLSWVVSLAFLTGISHVFQVSGL